MKVLSFFALCVSLIATPLAAEAKDLPLLFDARERIAKPDLTGLARLRFLTTVDFPPFNFIDQSGKLSGFHVDLVREICRELDIEAKCQIQAVTYAELLPALEEGQGEAVAAGIAVGPELRQRFGFSRAFMRLPARFAVNTKAAGAVSAPSDLKGKPVGVVAGTTHEAMFKAFFPKIEAKVYPDREAMLTALQKGDVPAVFSDGMQLSFWISGSAAGGCCTLVDGAYFSQRFLGEGLTIMNRKSEPALTQAIDHALLALSRSGRLEEIYLRYFPNGIY
ncbi:transporter substrate-binding domain-containing protein [Ensifer sp. ENS07]|jgi:polar amino acid transport system substrate-binding protein|uniref:Transporter substrate-binding domain-containing protein n=1 Tax=Ensifer adhaerens TaxID=106592 RepID=A0A9Q9D9E7_ENSAD|nr:MULTISPECIES: transporter substrate-binding domain-containing protein [Ensifer]MBD9555232.1 transporter substrate-binding domain-containing protein [Ensifer sp. ENS03]MBD9593172.1 transporter substrate-binding domain-containing protein [Ensifer sp. ENS05]MBD9638045.1 transporter substrate-binding domain-containing protein [Ensifer sp. ENS07]USJ23558.1 transporter substrate-binding domain-containing protein [Ensifer adhaerens]SDL75439.1 polar amino acid transport system substrate-binding pro